ncbi:MAG: hypothetical protein GH145_00765 [Firmicutes bacterium]|nr:hypothetical protein [Bacillota bacterium]
MVMQEQEVNLRDYIRVIKKRKKTILLLFFIAVISSAVVSFVLPPVYEVTLGMKIGDVIDVDTLEKELIESPIAASQFLKGPQTLIEAMKELKLPYTLEEFRKKVLIEPVRETEDLVQVRVHVNSPGEAVSIANYLGTKLLERHKEIKKLYENKVEILARYDEQIKQLNDELNEINKSKVEILARYDENIKEISDQLVLTKNEIDTTKKEMERLELSLEAVSKEIAKEIDGSESLSEAEANILVGRLNNMRSRWESYRGSIGGKQQQYDDLLEKLREIRLKKTEFQRTKQERYDTLMGELRQAQMEKTKLERINSVRMYNTEILVAAEKPEEPIKPNKLFNVAVTGIMALLFGLILVFFLESLGKVEK